MKNIVACLCLLIPIWAFAQTPINTVPYNITQPGRYYLAHDIIGNANAKIIITASNVLLDLQGCTLQVASSDIVVGIYGPGNIPGVPGVSNVVVKNGTLINTLAGCFFLNYATNCTIDNVQAVSHGKCTIFDQAGQGNRIINCALTGGDVLTPPTGGKFNLPQGSTISLLGCRDLVANNAVTGSISTYIQGPFVNLVGNAIRDNVVWETAVLGYSDRSGAIAISAFDSVLDNLIPGATKFPGSP